MRSCLITILLFTCISGSCQIDSILASELQNILDEQIDVGNNGVAACVIMPDGSEWHGQSGLDGDDNPIVEETVFHGASCLKTHVSCCLILLAEQGLVNLDAPWSDFVSPNVEFDPQISIRQLLNNTSGIADYLEIAGAGQTAIIDPSHFFTPYEILEEIVSQTPDFSAGTDFHYSSTNFVLAGLVIEAITGLPLYDALRQEIWNPLGLEHTYGGAYDEYSEPRAGVWWNFGFGFNNYSSVDETSQLSFGYGSSGIVSTPVDQAKFIRTLLTGNLIQDTSLTQMLTFIPESFDDWSAGYGMGLHHAINVGEDDVYGVDGYYTNMSSTFHNLTEGFTIATMTNTQSQWYGIFTPIFNEIKQYLASDISDQHNVNATQVFPNPSSESINISSLTFEVSEVEIINTNGVREEVEFSQLNDLVRVDVSNYGPGMITVVLRSETGETFDSKVVVK